MATTDLQALFGGTMLPQDMQQELINKRAREFATLTPSQQLGMMGYKTGAAIGGGLAQAMGVDITDPQIKRMSQLQALTQGAESTPEGLKALAKKLSDAGFSAEAAMAMDKAREASLTEAKTTSLVEDKQAAREQQLMLAREKIQAQIEMARERGATQLQIAQMAQEGRMQIAQLAAALKGEKPLTEYQGKSVTFGTRAAEANNILNNLEGEYSRMGATFLPSWLNSTEGQQAQQAQRNFVNAVLRQESGAAINASEFENARKQYFAQPGDEPAVVDQKKRNRELVIQGFSRQAGPGGKDIKEVFDNPPPKAPKTTFTSLAEAEKASLPKGTIITINGKKAIVE